MQTTKKKPSLIFILVGAVLAGYLGYLINGAWSEGVAFNEFMNRFNEVCAAPFANYYNTNTIKAVAIALGIYAMAIVMYYTSQRNYMPGKEFGTARFENPKQVNKILADKDENFNRILSQNVKISLDFRRLKLNGNILICGGSGAGKTFYEVKPNLMQMPHNCSFICTDPKGEILRIVRSKDVDGNRVVGATMTLHFDTPVSHEKVIEEFGRLEGVQFIKEI